MPELSIVIPTHAEGRRGARLRLARIRDLAESLRSQVRAPSWEAIIVANRQALDVREYLKSLDERFRYFETGTVGANVARNLGIENASAPLVLFLDDDCLASDPQLLHKHFENHRLNPDVTALGGPYLADPGASRVGRAYHRRQIAWLRTAPRPSCRADWLPGGNMSIKRQCLDQNRFEPRLIFGATETEFQLRLASGGHRIRLLDDLATVHRIGKLSFSAFLKKAFLQGAGGYWVSSRGLNPRALAPQQYADPNRIQTPTFLEQVYEWAFLAGQEWMKRRVESGPGRPGTLGLGLHFIKEVGLSCIKAAPFIKCKPTFHVIKGALMSRSGSGDSGPASF